MKKKVKIPVIGVGMVRDESLAKRAVEEEHCDIIAIGRGMLADPEFASKILNGKGDTIKPWRH
jgi:2,4-dienoyl-CoA reductase (NADPH2)